MKRLALSIVVVALAATLLSSTALAGFRGGSPARTAIRVHHASPTPFKHSGVADPFKHSGVADPFKRAAVRLGVRSLDQARLGAIS